jgi:hypothetical protein
MRFSNTENLIISEFALVFSSLDEILGGMITVFWDVTLCVQVHVSEEHAGTEVCCHWRHQNPPPFAHDSEGIYVKHN